MREVEATVGFYSRVVFPRICDYVLDKPFVAEHRRRLLAAATGDVMEIGFGTGLNLPYYLKTVRKITTVDPNVGMHRPCRKTFSRPRQSNDSSSNFIESG